MHDYDELMMLAMELAPEVALSDGNVLPHVGMGTSPMNDAEVEEAVGAAIDIGYRLFDTAVRYENEAGVGAGIRGSGIPRDEVFVATKIPGRHHGYESAKTSLDESLQRMALDYIDLYLIHWPNPSADRFVDTWRAFVDLQEEGKVRSIGVSNFKPHHLERIIDATGVTPAVNQIQLYPALPRDDARALHEKLGIVTQSWSPLGLGFNAEYLGGSITYLDNPTIVGVAEKYGRTAGQIVLRWHVQLGLVPLPKSSNKERLAQNLDLFSWKLDDADMQALAGLSGGSVEAVDSDTIESM